MNISSTLGVIAALAILVFGILTSTNNPMVFLDIHGIVIVIGGNAAAALM
jgi:flagellar motor component MotA